MALADLVSIISSAQLCSFPLVLQINFLYFHRSGRGVSLMSFARQMVTLLVILGFSGLLDLWHTID